MKKMKTTTLILLLLFISIITSAQLRVDNTGRIGMGTSFPNVEFKCHIKGNLLLTTYPEIPSNYPFGPIELRMKLAPAGFPGPTIGSSNDILGFYTEGNGFNKIFVEKIYRQSDKRTKTNIVRVKSSLATIKKFNCYSYSIKDSATIGQKSYGFMAQDVEKFLPEITDSAGGVKLIDYVQIIPLMVEAIKEQQQNIDSLSKELKDAKNKMTNCCNQTKHQSTRGSTEPLNSSSTVLSDTKSKLLQNKPNPFSEQTTIEFEIIENFKQASIMIFDMQGTFKKAISVTTNEGGHGQVIINGNEFTSGMYLYSLIVDDKEIDTKRMILTN